MAFPTSQQNNSKLNYCEPVHAFPDKKNFIHAYYGNLDEESGFIHEVKMVISDAEAYMDERVSHYSFSSVQTKFAIVLDIDETSLSNYFSIKEDNFTNDPKRINSRFHRTDSPAIKPVLSLFQKAVKNNVEVFFITARKPLDENPEDDLRSYAADNLLNAGYNGWSGLYMPQAEELKLPAAHYKTNIRRKLTEQGYQIILNIGDQDTDLEGGYAEKTIKVPNYLYPTSNQKKSVPGILRSSSFFFRQSEHNRMYDEPGKVNEVKNFKCAGY